MKIFLDTANLDEIRWATNPGLIDGVVTSTAAIAAEDGGSELPAHLLEICRLVHGPVSVDIAAVDVDGMYREGRDLARLADNVVVRIPMIEEGIIAMRRLSADGVRVNTSLVFTAAQALLAAKAGAAYVSPFVSRIDDLGHDTLAVIRDIREVFDSTRVECEVIGASVSSAFHFTQCAKIGIDIAAVSPSVLRGLLVHPLTDRGLDELLTEWSQRIAKSRTEA